MAHLDVLGSVFSTVITIVLAFSLGMARFLAHTPNNKQGDTDVTAIPEQKLDTSLLQSLNESIRRQLHASKRYQQAAAVEARATSSPVSEAVSIESALVNVFCTARTGDTVRTVTGSGVFIDARGVILTNAHIAQFLLLTEERARTHAQCIIRQGSPAISKYKANLLYISPTWIARNAPRLYAERPSGTGEHDFALMYVTEAIEGDLPEIFPSLVPASETDIFNQMPMRAAGYPAEILTVDTVRAPLVPIIATTSVTHLFTFGSGKIDLIAIAPSVVGQQGSSGGPIVNEEGGIVGLIVTRGNRSEEGAQSLRALTIPYVDRTLMEETGLTLARTLTGDIALRAQVFHETIAPYLRTLLLDTL